MPRVKCPMCSQSTDAAADHCQFCGHRFDAERSTREEQVVMKAASAEVGRKPGSVPPELGGADESELALEREAETALYFAIGAIPTVGVLAPFAIKRGRHVNAERAKLGMRPSSQATWAVTLSWMVVGIWAVGIVLLGLNQLTILLERHH